MEVLTYEQFKAQEKHYKWDISDEEVNRKYSDYVNRQRAEKYEGYSYFFGFIAVVLFLGFLGHLVGCN